MSTEAEFIASILPEAQKAAATIGWWPSVVLAQWADETGWGTSSAWLDGHNPAGISPNGEIAAYPSIAAGVVAYEDTALSSYYTSVYAAQSLGPEAQATALGESPWAGGHYGSPPGSNLVAIIAAYDLNQYNTFTPPVPQPAPVPPATPGDDDDVQLPQVQQGSTGLFVKSVQALLHDKFGQGAVAVDGNFGPVTELAVKTAQRFYSAPQDGVVGPVTWALLLGPG